MNRAFSLVELSIVLVILGLLTGGVLTGQSLIRASEMRSITTDYQRYIASIQAFRDKYFAIPGDMANAQSFWGVAHATPATCITTASTTTATCNGDGNGSVNYSGVAGSNETFRFWQHLANAGLIEGQYDGITHGATAYAATTANSPKSKINNAIWYTTNMGSPSGAGTYFNGTYNHTMIVGGAATDQRPTGAILKPEEMWNIDTKMDDGKPATGKVVVYSPSGLSASTTTVANNPATTTADYLLTNSSIVCVPYFIQAY